MFVFYKFSDKGKSVLFNGKPINKAIFFKNALHHFQECKFILFLDNCSDTSIEFFKQFKFEKIFITTLGTGETFRVMLDESIKLEDNEIVYFLEDDYLHCANSKKCIEEGLNIADFVTLYDSPDKYINGFLNVYIEGGGENTKVLLTTSTHWKYTCATTGTFAAKVSTLKRDISIFKSYIGHNVLGQSDFKDTLCFLELVKKGRKLISSIPSKSSHIISWYPFNAPIINWENILNESKSL